MTTYRRFVAKAHNDAFVITELESTEKAPLNWTDGCETRESAWDKARSQVLPLVFKTQDGTETNFGVVFSPAKWEEAVYRGYVAYGFSMTDGHYAPLSFEQYVVNLRTYPEVNLNENDCSPAVKAALPAYLAALASI